MLNVGFFDHALRGFALGEISSHFIVSDLTHPFFLYSAVFILRSFEVNEFCVM